jgi:hypothetical protein
MDVRKHGGEDDQRRPKRRAKMSSSNEERADTPTSEHWQKFRSTGYDMKIKKISHGIIFQLLSLLHF